ncbi:MAG: hypothetical protein ACR2N6_06250 [Miltoncostaeaceae bacterium]
MAGALLIAAVLVPSDATAASGKRVVVDGFEAGTPKGWTAAKGGKVQRVVRRSGRHALRTTHGRATTRLLRNFRTARSVRVGMHMRVARRGPQTFLAFRRNGVRLVTDGRRRLQVVVRGKRVRTIRLPFSSRRWHRVTVEMRSRSNRVVVFVGRRRVARIAARLRPESSVAIGDLDRRLSGPVFLDNVSVVTKATLPRRSAPGAVAPTAGPAPAPAEPPAGGSPPSGASDFFSPTSVWNRQIGANPQIDPNSAAIVNDLADQVNRYVPWFNYNQYSTPVYVVGPDQPTRQVIDSDDGFLTTGGTHHWNQVPIPTNAQPAGGTDKHLVIWQPSTDTMWEFWLFEWSNGTPRAAHGARIPNVSSSPGALPRPYGATASGLPMVAGMMMVDELRSGTIDHALALAVPEPRAGVFAAPATRTDGFANRSSAPPEGAHFQLDPTLDLDSLGLTPFTRMVAEAAQKYGIVVRDKSGSVSFYGEDPINHSGNPYGGILGPNDPGALRDFPWNRLRLLQMDLS